MITCGYNDANQINYRNNATEVINYQHDDNGNLISETSNVNGTTTYGYDYENRLTQVISPQSEVRSFTYNGTWQRTSVSENANVVRYIYDGMLPAVERDSAGNTLAAYTRIPDIAGGIGGLVSRWNGTATHYYHNLMLDNATRISDDSGSIVQAYDYDAFGNVVSQTGSLINNYQFQDKEALEDFGLVFYEARYYKPILGRFINQDPLGMIDGPNLYRFCLGDPVNYLDPYGLYVLPPKPGPVPNPNPPGGIPGSGVPYGDIHGEKPDTHPGAAQINAGGCEKDGGEGV